MSSGKSASERSIDDDDIYTTTGKDVRNLSDMKDVNLSDDDLSIPTSTFTDELFSSTRDEDEAMENGVRKLPSTTGRRRKRSFCCICQRVVTPICVILFATIFAIFYFGNTSKLEGIIPGSNMLFDSEDLGEQFVWKRSNVDGGLTLNIVNALDTEWYTYFDVAVSDWDNGSPDALTLSSEVANAPDPDCAMIEGVLKMCNGDYGNTGWMGINEVLKFQDEIAGSTGKMNDYFFKSSSFGDHAKRQYTMCHEMGHGFGLPHTDTTMWNRNTGNCLDYTNRPKKNMRPGQINYDRLAKVYGTVGNTTASGSNTASTGSSSSNNANSGSNNISTNPPASDDDGNNDDQQGNSGSNGGGGQSNGMNNNGNNKNNKNNGGRRDLSSGPPSSRPTPASVLEQIRQIREEYHAVTPNNSNRRYLFASSVLNNDHNSNSHYEIDLGSGYTLKLHFLNA